MAKDYTFLKYTDIPFSFTLITIIFGVNVDNYQSLLPFIILSGSIIASTLELINPIKIFIFNYTLFYYKKHNLLLRPNKEPINIYPISQRAFYSEYISKSKDKITSIGYFIILSIITMLYRDLKSIADLLNMNFILFQSIFIIILALVIIYWIFEILNLPKKEYLVIIYLLKIEGANPANIDELKGALDAEDWVIARNWVRQDVIKKFLSDEPPEVIFGVVEWWGKLLGS